MTRKLTEWEKLDNQLILGQCRIGEEAARDIARRITNQHGFWDYEERKRAQRARNGRGRLTLLPGGGQPAKAA